MRRAANTSFTLIELLVVVAIIALLISILLPSLGRAREQGRQTVCIANLKSIGVAMTMYGNDWREWFPFERMNWPIGGTSTVMTAFYYGGHPGRPGPSPAQPTAFDNPGLRDSFASRPFNRYLYQNLRSTVEQNSDVNRPDFDTRRREMRVFACPSDTGAFYQNDPNSPSDNVLTTFDYFGTSYDINYQFVWLWAAGCGSLAPPPSYPPYPRTDIANVNYLQIANNFLKAQRKRSGASFVVLYEDAFDTSLYQRLPREGWHKQYQRHSFLYIDAHAANVYTNVTQGPDGPKWKTSAGSAWYTDPNHPDYDLRTIGP